MDETVDVDDSEMDRRLWMASTWDDNSSKRRRKYLQDWMNECLCGRISLLLIVKQAVYSKFILNGQRSKRGLQLVREKLVLEHDINFNDLVI